VLVIRVEFLHDIKLALPHANNDDGERQLRSLKAKQKTKKRKKKRKKTPPRKKKEIRKKKTKSPSSFFVTADTATNNASLMKTMISLPLLSLPRVN
jgi:hypothetical protein